MMLQNRSVLLWLIVLASCKEPFCGNNVLEEGEVCDDGNKLVGDGCHSDCRTELTRSYLLSSFDLPQTNEELHRLSRDFNEDSVINAKDNGLQALADIFDFLGINAEAVLNRCVQNGSVLLGNDIIAADFGQDNQALFIAHRLGLIGELSLNGSNLVFTREDFEPTQGSITGDNLFIQSTEWLFPLMYQDGAPLFLPLRNVKISGTVTNKGIGDGVVAGTINALDFAETLKPLAEMLNERIYEEGLFFGGGTSPIFCGQEDDCPFSGICTDQDNNPFATGLCIQPQDAALLFSLDSDRDGHIEVFYSEPGLTFFQNELSPLFTLSNLVPSGLFGDLFLLDTNEDGIRDSMPIGFGFSSVLVTRLP
jgi:cysteine-rich repeat protein